MSGFQCEKTGVCGFLRDLSLIAFLTIKSNKTIQSPVNKLLPKFEIRASLEIWGRLDQVIT